MKLNSFFTLFLCIVVVTHAIPIPAGGADDKGKGRADGPNLSPPRSPSPGSSSDGNTPTPSVNSDVPLPGRHGVFHDPKKNVVTASYGDDKLPEHMRHVEDSQKLNPIHKKPAEKATPDEKKNNRDQALAGIQSGVKHPVTGEPLNRDEKPIAMLKKDPGATTTVQLLSQAESNREGALTSSLSSTMDKHNAKGQIRANPGLLTLSPNQRIGHEAPGRLNSETRVEQDTSAGSSRKKSKAKVDPKVTAEKEKLQAEADARRDAGYTPKTAGGLTLRHRKAEPPVPPRVQKQSGGPAKDAVGTNLVSTRPLEPGQRWTPGSSDGKASHFGAPPPNTDSDTRHPPRPQNREAYMAQRNRPRPGTPPVGDPHPGPELNDPKFKTDQFKKNLEKFTNDHPTTQHANNASGAHRAPAALGGQTPDGSGHRRTASAGASTGQSNTVQSNPVSVAPAAAAQNQASSSGSNNASSSGGKKKGKKSKK